MQRDYPISKIIKQLERSDLIPAIVFRTSRRGCDMDLQQLARKSYNKADPEQTEAIREKVDSLCEQHGWERELIVNNLQYKVLLSHAAGAHHAGQLLTWRLLLEELMSAGMLRLLIATGTVAAGVDFPARTVVVTAHSKRGHDGFNVLTASEFQQMSGRAGRRGKDTVGFCLMAPSPFCDARVLAKVSESPPEPLRSAYFASPSTVLNLLKYRSVEELRFTVQNSLAGFVDEGEAVEQREFANQEEERLSTLEEESREYKKLFKKVRRLRRKADERAAQQLTQLELTLSALVKLNFITTEGVLTEKGHWAAELCTNLVLELAEAIENFMFSDVSSIELVGLVASIAGDPYRNYLKVKNSKVSNQKFEQLSELVENIADHYTPNANSSEVAVVSDAAATVETWVETKQWSDFTALLRLANVADGDAARLIMQTADHLQQISRLSESHPALAELAVEARGLLLRPPLSDVV